MKLNEKTNIVLIADHIGETFDAFKAIEKAKIEGGKLTHRDIKQGGSLITINGITTDDAIRLKDILKQMTYLHES